jgi:hypothetical protein
MFEDFFLNKKDKKPIKHTPNISIVDKAFTSGLKPSLTLEKTTIGNVLEPGPLVKLATTKSSSERVNANNQPDIIDGAIMGSVILYKTL